MSEDVKHCFVIPVYNHPHYLEIVKDPALRLRNFKNKVVEKQ